MEEIEIIVVTKDNRKVTVSKVQVENVEDIIYAKDRDGMRIYVYKN